MKKKLYFCSMDTIKFIPTHSFLLEEESPILSQIQDTLSTVAHNTNPYMVMGQDVTWITFAISIIACVAGIMAAIFAFNDWRTQKRTADGIDKQNKRYLDFASVAKHLYRTLVYGLAIDCMYRRELKNGNRYYPEEVYFEKTKVYDDFLPVQSFINVEGSQGPINDLRIQIKMLNVEHDDAIKRLREFFSSAVTSEEFDEHFPTIFSNMTYKPYHIIAQMMETERRLDEAHAISVRTLTGVDLAKCIIEKHLDYVKSNASRVMSITKKELDNNDIDFSHFRRSCARFADDDYSVSLFKCAGYEMVDKDILEHIALMANNESYDSFVTGKPVRIWDIIEVVYKIEVACELHKMHFIVR